MRSRIIILLCFAGLQVINGQNTPEPFETDSLHFYLEDPFRPVYKVVEQMPRFPGCEDIDGTDFEKYQCAQTKFLEYIYKNVRCGPVDRRTGIPPSRIVFHFVIDETGTLEEESLRIVKGIENPCSSSLYDILRTMTCVQSWTPGMQGGRAVRVEFTLPVQFCYR